MLCLKRHDRALSKRHFGASVIVALKAYSDWPRLVPERLWKYFDDHVVISGWYPEQDYFVLIEALAKKIDPKSVGGDVWRYFARFSAQRDIGRSDGTGAASGVIAVYRNFASGGAEPEPFFRRAVRIWSQYHDSGTMQLRGGSIETNTVVIRLADFHIPIEGFVRLQGFYLEEFGRLMGLEVASRVVRSTARGDAFCEWEYRLARGAIEDAYVASLPRLQL
jgi:hypothetical protein